MSGSRTHVDNHQLAGVAARAIAVEMVLFEAFGRWITTTSQASVKPLLAAESRRHAWRAGLWRDRYPLIPDADVDEAVGGARADLVAVVDALAVFDASPSGPGGPGGGARLGPAGPRR